MSLRTRKVCDQTLEEHVLGVGVRVKRRDEAQVGHVVLDPRMNGIVVDEKEVGGVEPRPHDVQILDVRSVHERRVVARKEHAHGRQRDVRKVHERVHDLVRVRLGSTRPKPQLVQGVREDETEKLADKRAYMDVHGRMGEDGVVGVPVIGNGVHERVVQVENEEAGSRHLFFLVRTLFPSFVRKTFRTKTIGTNISKVKQRQFVYQQKVNTEIG